MPRPSRWVFAIGLILAAGCSSDDGGSGVDPTSPVTPDDRSVPAEDFIAEIGPAIDAVDDELGGPQEYFEVTATAQLVNVFVAVEDATAVDAYLWVDGELQPPAPRQAGASGNTFTASDVDLDPVTVLDQLATELPETAVEAFSIYGDGLGATYVVAGRSTAGGVLDIVLGPDGSIVSVDPV